MSVESLSAHAAQHVPPESINVVAVNSLFLAMFLGIAVRMGVSSCSTWGWLAGVTHGSGTTRRSAHCPTRRHRIQEPNEASFSMLPFSPRFWASLLQDEARSR